MKTNEETPLLNKKDDDLATENGNSSPFQVSVNIMKGCLGTGILSLPWAFAKSSYIGSYTVFPFVTVYCLISSMVVIQCCEQLQIFSYDGLLKSIPRFGPVLEKISAFILIIHCILSCASYVVLAGDTFVNFFDSSEAPQVWMISATLVTLFIYFPTCLLDFSQLSFISIVGILSTFYVFFLVLFPSPDTIRGSPVPIFELNFSWCSTASISVQSYLTNGCMPPIYKSMKDRSPSKFKRSFFFSYFVVFLLYVVFTLFALNTFGESAPGNIMLSMPSSIFVSAGRFGIFLSIIGTFSIILSASTGSIEQNFYQGRYPSFTTKAICIGAQCSVAYIVGITIPNLGVVNVMNGALSTATLFGIFPALMAIYHLRKPVLQYSIFALIGVSLAFFSFLPLL